MKQRLILSLMIFSILSNCRMEAIAKYWFAAGSLSGAGFLIQYGMSSLKHLKAHGLDTRGKKVVLGRAVECLWVYLGYKGYQACAQLEAQSKKDANRLKA